MLHLVWRVVINGEFSTIEIPKCENLPLQCGHVGESCAGSVLVNAKGVKLLSFGPVAWFFHSSLTIRGL